MATVVRWIVGVGLAQEERGALEYGRWLKAHCAAALEAVTVARFDAPDAPDGAGARVLGEFRRAQQRVVDASGPEAGFEACDVVVSSNAERVLAARAEERNAGIIVGRAAPRGAVELTRLGRTTRRLLRALPGPTAVVPADLRAEDVPDGPVVLGWTLDPSASEAARFARRLALAVRRDIVCVHAVEPERVRVAPDHTGPAEPLPHDDRRRALLESGLADVGLAGRPLTIAAGSPTEVIVQHAERNRACAIVCGSRRLSTLARVFAGSTASAVASIYDGPVIVVPPS